MEQKVEKVSVPFVTLRNRTGEIEPANFYGGSRGKLEAGFCTVAFSPIWGLEDIAQSIPFYIPDEKIELVTIQEASLTELGQKIKSRPDKDQGNLVLYIHGYNIDFEKSCRRGALLKMRNLLFFCSETRLPRSRAVPPIEVIGLRRAWTSWADICPSTVNRSDSSS